VKTLKDLLKKEPRVTGQENMIPVDQLTSPDYRRAQYDGLAKLMASIENGGLRHPVTAWTGNLVISGSRRVAAYRALVAMGHEQYRNISVVHVDNIEDAAKRVMEGNGDEGQSAPMKPSDLCHWWDVMRGLDAPAAARRLDEARRQGVALRRATQAGKRQPGRSHTRGRGIEYQLSILAEPFGMSEATASRLYAIHQMTQRKSLPADRRQAAADALDILDRGESSIWRSYAALLAGRNPTPNSLRAAPASTPVPAARQVASWDRALPKLEGMVAGLVELGPPNPDLTWHEVGPVHARLAKARRDLEKIINKMRETNVNV
jgi:hypothetical protein